MRDRCYNQNNVGFKNYGGRGLTVCSGFMKFENFIRIMGDKPERGLSIERKDNSIGYFCGECSECVSENRDKNCIWATRAAQNRNRRDNVVLELDGKSMVMRDWTSELSLSKRTIQSRIRRGKTSADEILSKPRKISKKQFIELNGEIHSIAEWAKILGIKSSAISGRLHRGITEPERILAPIQKRRKDSI